MVVAVPPDETVSADVSASVFAVSTPIAALCEKRFVLLAVVANKFVEVEFVNVPFVAVKFVTKAFVEVALVVVAFVAVRLVMVATAALSELKMPMVKLPSTEKSVVDVALVVEALVAKKVVEVALANVVPPVIVPPPESERYVPERSGMDVLSIVEFEMVTSESVSILFASAMVLDEPPPSGGVAFEL